MTPRHTLSRFSTLAVLLAACDGDAPGPDASASLDAPRVDASAPDDAPERDAALEIDASSAPDAAVDDDAASTPDAASTLDAASTTPDAFATDAGSVADAATAANSCVAGGGRCEPVIPGSCATGIVGDPDVYSCGGGLGVLCCLPGTTPPTCRNIGTRSEGWYRADGMRICFASCGGATITCEAIGTRSEGWYTDPDTAACGSIPVPRLVEWADCSP